MKTIVYKERFKYSFMNFIDFLKLKLKTHLKYEIILSQSK
jgi:hypothetical protein